MKTKILQLLIFVLFGFIANAQVTTSSMTGKVTDDAGEPLIGATVIATHTPSGTQYGTVTNENGIFAFSNMRPGGPYKVDFSYVGFKTSTFTEINLRLGESYNLATKLINEAVQLESLVIEGTKSNILNSNRTGAATNVNEATISSLPTISRSINDFTRLTPQAQSGNGFGGRDGRYNNIQIDGANFNNNFGLSTTNLPGGGSQPISLDAIDQIQINMAPYDVRQSNFTGAGINAVTKSGTNSIEGSVYGYYRNQDFNGKYIGKDTLPPFDKTTSQIFGARLGGAIIKNKLFYFLNFEKEDNTRPGINYIPSADGRTGSNVSRTTLADMITVQNYVKNNYNYDTGAPEGYASNFVTANYKALARIDYNFNSKNKLTFRYNQVIATDDQVVNGTSAPNPRSSSNRISANSYAFENANYGFENSVRSFTAELNSQLSNNLSNQFLTTYTRIQDKRTSKSEPFPFIDIKKDGDSYMSLGYELFSWKNDVINNVMTFTDNVTLNFGKHNIVGGVTFDYLKFGNSFQRYGTSYYRFKSLNDFLTNAAPEAFAITYSVLPDKRDPYAELAFGLGGIYIQDEFRVNDNFKLTGGLRIDLPLYLNSLETNPAVNALKFLDVNGKDTIKLDVANWPTSSPLFSPRIGFNYDVKGDRSFQVRGGTGIFTGRIPFVWFTNMPTNSGMLQNTVEVIKEADLANLKFNQDPKHYLSNTTLFPETAGKVAPGSIAAIDKDFKLPQVWRTNLAIDYKLPFNTVLTLEGLYTKDINAVYQFNANQKAPIGNMKAYNGKDDRPFFGATNNDRRVNSAMSEAIVLSNTDKGSSYSLSISLTKELANNFSGALAYTFTNSSDITGNPGSQASSAWSNNPSINGQNNLDLSYSEFAVPHRIVGSLSYKIEYLKVLGTTLSLYYEGSHTGRFSYRYTADFNRDGINADLIYIPESANDISFTDIKSGNNVLFTAQQQSEAFFKYIDQDSYLSQNKGKYAERNGALFPWRNRFDLKVLQDLFTKIGGKNRTLQFSLDILNVGNLINPNWGIIKTLNYSNAAILKPTVASDGSATFQMNTVNNKLVTETFKNVLSTSTTYGMQIGLRFIF